MAVILDVPREEEVEKERLVELARTGNQHAFNELVRLHRARAHGWAYSVTKDTFLAEDIVQEALFRAFLKLGTLMDTKKFTPWLRQIVRNEALMKIRTASYRMEAPSSENVDWANIDQILSFLSTKATEKAKQQNPEEHLLRLSVIEGICSLMSCLSKKEKAIFEAYFFEDLPPYKIAELFHTTKANIYSTLSRSKLKIQKERRRICIQQFVQRKKLDGATRRKILREPDM
ncbi:RNA polymerase sigma factor [Sutcliffiella rhizosphaerae]|uniref:RNA polymerase sigma factor n=1 Tax=Sutcliffiella rhizosphaerae TaxID=2880967 RepID=A0ABM8YK15_9BACI|nr:sigma-70 family RNA polymerase sigma factor [Sutcliffiella rhizosphaerae]CAG9620258.1 hypothetical protein BACCIP111883_01026 [Sutcliffiella rhizosphaerae]